MELLIVLGLLYGLQCLVWLPRGAQLFVQPFRGWLVSSGPGWRLLHPLPSGRAFLAARFPLVERESGLHGRGAVTWSSGREWGAPSAPVERGALGRAVARRSVVRLDGRPLARGASAAHAEALAASLRELGEARGDEARECARQMLERALSPARFEEARARVDSATRWLGWASDFYWVALFGLAPVCVAELGEERGLLFALPALAALHLASLACFARAHRKLFPGRAASLVEALFAAGLYPPLLLRLHDKLWTEVLSGFHPAVVAAAVLPPEERIAFLRAERVRVSARISAAARRGDVSRLGLDALELRALRDLLEALELSEGTLLAAPPRRDPFAESHCPACLCEYRCDAGCCSDCRIALVPYGS